MNLITRRQVIEGSGTTLMARINTPAGVPVIQSDISSITIKVYDMADGTLVVNPTITVAGSISNTLVTDARWTEDSTGANVLVALAGTAFPRGNTTYRAEIFITPVSGTSFYIIFELECIAVFSQ